MVFLDRMHETGNGTAAVIGAGPLLAPGEVALMPGESFEMPEVVFVWSGDGLDGVSAALHRYVRDLASCPSRPRPLTLNTWEAVYFSADRDRLHALVDAAHEVGVERFVLDDGWFLGRRDASHGLGDWVVDPDVWPNGLGELADHVRASGMELGLWFEPEMVSPGSSVLRDHPEWLLGRGASLGIPWRGQWGIDLSQPEAFEHIRHQMESVIERLGVDCLKWDHNRDLLDPVGSNGRPGVVRQTRAVYALMDALHDRFPALEIESCASGGGRIDLGVLARAQRVWPSDTNDPVERQRIQFWTGLVVPLERLGTHVGPEEAHTTFRKTDLPFRLVTAFFGHAGIEWDLLAATAQERSQVSRWAAYYKEKRGLLHHGVRVTNDEDPRGVLLGVVAQDRSEAVFQWARLTSERLNSNPVVRLPGLDPDRRYAIHLREDAFGAARRFHATDPAWVADGALLSGAVLGTVGLPMCVLAPQQAQVLELTAQEDEG